MKVSEKLMLISKGYSKKEIQELEKQEAEEIEESAKEPEPVKEEKTEPEKEPETDYKKLYEESQKALFEAQKNNSRADISEDLNKKQQEADESLKKLVQSFM